MSDVPTEPPAAHPAAPPRMSVGAVLGDAFALYRAHFARFFLLAFAVFIVLDLGFALIATGLSDRGVEDDLFAGGATDNLGGLLLGGFAWIVVSVVGWLWLEGALVFAVQDARYGAATTSIQGMLSRAWPYVWRLLGAGLPAALGIAAGFILLVLPGIYLAVIWSMIVPTIVLEQASAGESFGRSRALVRGRFWSVLGTIVIALVISGIVSSLISLPFSALPDFFEVWLGGAVSSAVTTPFVAVVVVYTYFALAAEKDAAAGQAAADA
jgi:hypothetical protein